MSNDGESIEQAAFRVLSERLNQEKSLLRKLESLAAACLQAPQSARSLSGF